VLRSARSLGRRVLGVQRTPTYYLPWLVRPGLECVLVLNNVEARFKTGFNKGPFAASVVQYDAGGIRGRPPRRRARRSHRDGRGTARRGGRQAGFATVAGTRIFSDQYVTLSYGTAYTATHGRQEFVRALSASRPHPARARRRARGRSRTHPAAVRQGSVSLPRRWLPLAPARHESLERRQPRARRA
jgi:hypothetical protein